VVVGDAAQLSSVIAVATEVRRLQWDGCGEVAVGRGWWQLWCDGCGATAVVRRLWRGGCGEVAVGRGWWPLRCNGRGATAVVRRLWRGGCWPWLVATVVCAVAILTAGGMLERAVQVGGTDSSVMLNTAFHPGSSKPGLARRKNVASNCVTAMGVKKPVSLRYDDK